MNFILKSSNAWFNSLNDLLKKESIFGELYLVGGAVMCLVFKARESTRDVDALFEPKTKIRPLAKKVGVEFGVGFEAARLKGSENNDSYVMKDGEIEAVTNNAGGVLGGRLSAKD